MLRTQGSRLEEHLTSTSGRTELATEPPLDFLTYLEQRYQANRALVTSLLGEWLVRYEPCEQRAILVAPSALGNRVAPGAE
ncbi:MAG TPA: hypothetical protein VFQ61_12510 [Polyangiaceae bacterium]|nr:hypothetical protein [Polyangiaceae bacterium]